jgi:hypothetical protein
MTVVSLFDVFRPLTSRIPTEARREPISRVRHIGLDKRKTGTL